VVDGRDGGKPSRLSVSAHANRQFHQFSVPANENGQRSVEQSAEAKCHGHQRGQIEGAEAPDDYRNKHLPRESCDHLCTCLTIPVSTELRAAPQPHAISAAWVGRQRL
jgi:hypothetical protein